MTAKRRRVSVKAVRAKELRALRAELRRRTRAQLVLTLVDFLRQLLERQAIRRLDEGTLTAAETEAVGLALMRIEKALRELARRFGLTLEDLKLDLGPLGRLT
jgi:hypothetical protein